MSNYTRKDILQKIKERQSLDGKNLSGLDLSLIDFGEISLQKANLRGANLQQSVFLETNLQDANLSGADLRGADLHMADLSQARLNGADLSEANLHMTKLVQADLRRANLQKANLHGSDLRRANLAGADFEDALLLGANLGEALLTVSDFKKLDLSQAINSSVKFVEHSLFEPNDSSDEGKEEKAEEIRPAVNEHTERLGLKFYVEQKKNQNTTQVFLGKALTPVSGFEKKDQTGKNKGKIAAVAVSAVVLGIILFTGIFRLESNSGFYKGFRLISPPGKGYIQGEILRFRAAAGDEGKRERLWVELIDNFNEKPVFDHLIRDEKDPRIWELEIDSQIIKSGNYRLFYGPSKKKLAPVENADKVIISVAPPKYDLTRILSAQGNRSYSLHFIGSLVQTGQENIPYLLVKIGPYRMVTIRPEPVAVQNKEVKYQLDVKLNGLKKTDLSEGEGNFYEEYLCDRAGHKKLIYKVTGMAEFFEKPGRAVDYRQGSVSREFTALITPDGKKQPADLFPVSENPGFKLVAKNQADEPGTFELTISRPANFLKSAVYLYQDNRLFGVTCETTFKVSGRWEGGHYHGLLIPEGKDVVYKSNILRTEVTGKEKKPDRAWERKRK